MLSDEWAATQSKETSDLAEEAVVSLFLIDQNLRLDVGGLKPAHFSSTHLAAAFDVAMHTKHIDMVTWAHALDAKSHSRPNDGWAAFLSGLSDRVNLWDAEEIGNHSRIIQEAAMLRRGRPVAR